MTQQSGQAPPPDPQAGAGSTTQTTGGAGADGTQSVASLPEWAQALLKETRAEAAKSRTENKTLAEKLAAIDAEKLSETEKLQLRAQEAEKRATEADGKRKETLSRLEVERQARKLNIVDEDTAALLIASKIEFDAEGKPTNIETLLADLVKAKPYLVAAAGQSQQNAGSAANAGRSSGLTIEDVKKMTREQIQANWAAVQAALASAPK